MESKVGTNTSVNWPTGIGGKGNEGVAGQIKQTPGAVGYVELIYAVQNKMPLRRSEEWFWEVCKAIARIYHCGAGDSGHSGRLPFFITNAPGPDAYPICGATWLLVYEQQKDAAKGRKACRIPQMGREGREKMATDLQYAPLPDSLQQRVLKRIDEIKM